MKNVVDSKNVTYYYPIAAAVLIILLSISGFADKKEVLNLPELHRQGKLEVVNRKITHHKENGKEFITLDRSEGEGAVWLPVKPFTNGTITIVARGRDVLQGSFMGIFFHGKDTLNFDNIYCRPFNFRTEDPQRKIHAIQYSSAPKYSWEYLRKERNGSYEKGIANAPQADDWITLSITIHGDMIKAYINHSKTPSLEVKKLNTNTTGKVGISGFNADFQSVTIERLP